MLSIFLFSAICGLHFIHLSTSETLPWIRSLQGDISDSVAGQRRTSKSFNVLIIQKKRKDQIRRKICNIIDCRNKTNNGSVRDVKMPPTSLSEFKCPKEISNVSKTAPVCSELTDLTNDTHCMMFRIPEVYFIKGSELSGADVYVHIKVKKNKKKKRKRRITLKISRYNEMGNDKKVVARLKFRPIETNWYKVSLPLSTIKKVLRMKKRSLVLCIECKKCNKKTKLTFPVKKRKNKKTLRKIKRKNAGKRKRKRLQRKRPFLVCHTKVKNGSTSKRQIPCVKSCKKL